MPDVQSKTVQVDFTMPTYTSTNDLNTTANHGPQALELKGREQWTSFQLSEVFPWYRDIHLDDGEVVPEWQAEPYPDPLSDSSVCSVYGNDTNNNTSSSDCTDSNESSSNSSPKKRNETMYPEDYTTPNDFPTLTHNGPILPVVEPRDEDDCSCLSWEIGIMADILLTLGSYIVSRASAAARFITRQRSRLEIGSLLSLFRTLGSLFTYVTLQVLILPVSTWLTNRLPSFLRVSRSTLLATNPPAIADIPATRTGTPDIPPSTTPLLPTCGGGGPGEAGAEETYYDCERNTPLDTPAAPGQHTLTRHAKLIWMLTLVMGTTSMGFGLGVMTVHGWSGQ